MKQRSGHRNKNRSRCKIASDRGLFQNKNPCSARYLSIEEATRPDRSYGPPSRGGREQFPNMLRLFVGHAGCLWNLASHHWHRSVLVGRCRKDTCGTPSTHVALPLASASIISQSLHRLMFLKRARAFVTFLERAMIVLPFYSFASALAINAGCIRRLPLMHSPIVADETPAC